MIFLIYNSDFILDNYFIFSFIQIEKNIALGT